MQDHLIRAMLGQAGYGSLTNPGEIRMLYTNADPNLVDYRYLQSSYSSSVTQNVAFDYSASVPSTLGYVVHSGVPEPSPFVLSVAGMLVFLTRPFSSRRSRRSQAAANS